MAAREPPRATNAGGPAARDECVGHERERGRIARPLAIASSAASDRRGGRVYWRTVPPLLLVARPWSAAPRHGRLVRALGQRLTRARPDAPLGCRGSDHAAEHRGARRTMLPACPCTWRRAVAPPPICLTRLAVRHATGPHPTTAPPPPTAATQPSLFGRLCRCAASREESTLVRAASVAVRHSAASRGLVQARARSRV